MRVLLVEDERALQDVVARGLRQAGIAVDVADDGDAALEKVWHTQYDVIVLDRDLPGVHGDEVCREVVASPDAARVLMLTASGAVADRVTGLMIGADDYLTKPFAMPELIARVHALNRRAVRPVPPVMTHGDIRLEPARHEATRAGRDLRLTPKELALLEVLMTDAGRVVSAEELLEKVWDEHMDPFTNAIRVTIMTLRRKLGEPPVIETITGVGYRLT